MSENGKLTDVLIEEETLTDQRTGLEHFWRLSVWADAGNEAIIKAVPGVTTVYHFISEVNYDVSLDPRYDRAWVKAEIEAAIRIGKQP